MELLTENIVVVGVRQDGDKNTPTVTVVNTDGREKTFDTTQQVVDVIDTHGFTHDKNRSYTLNIDDKTGVALGVIAGELRVPRGLKLATLAHNYEPANAIVFRRDRKGKGVTKWTPIKVPMGIPQERLDEMGTKLSTAKIGESIGYGYNLFRTIDQAPEMEFCVLTK